MSAAAKTIGEAVVCAERANAQYLQVSQSDPQEAQMVSTDQPQRVSPWMDTEEAASYLGARPGTLKNWRHRGEGPKYHVVNRRLVRYHQSDLDAFARGISA